MKYIYIFILFIITQPVKSQTPGCFGKKFTIQYNAAMSSRYPISLLFRSKLTYGNHADTRYNSLNYKNNLLIDLRHDFELNYMLNKNKSLDLKFSTFKTGSIAKSNSSELNGYFDPEESIDINYNIKGKHFALGFKGYFNNIAPIGIYLGLFAGLTFENIEFSDFNHRIYKEYNKTFILLGVQYGKRYLFGKRIILDIGSTIMWSNNGTEFNYSYYTSRAFLFNFFRAHVGIGYIF